MKKHLVLGSEGQIGKYVCNEIVERGDEVIRWDIVLDEEHDLRYLDRIDNNDFLDVMYSADFVHFLAYEVGGSKYLAANQNSYKYIQSNIDIMRNVFHNLEITKKPFYFASSQMSNMTDSVYGQLKAIGESYTKALGGVNVKFWNVYGYESDPEKSHVITDFIKMMLEDGHILCRTNGLEKRHFTYAKDAARMLYKITSKYQNCVDYTNNRYSDGYMSLKSDGSIHIVDCYAPWYAMHDVAEIVDRRVHNYWSKPLLPGNKHNGFYSRSADKTQTIINEFNHHAIKVLNEIQNNFTYLEKGIAEMVELIGKDYERTDLGTRTS